MLVLGELEREKPPIYSIKKTLLFHLETKKKKRVNALGNSPVSSI